ncbi:hypothetical protein F5Y00DRAFT_255752 [Daldinia vernicosa]|uniref:uncharacterized protein n=1 Tax=Daldinia vernicosa TaxID=114800 RepID=UPI00200891A7|nr:uncharacterized protein F5Y00DRAFT_255752 [Daldinia vernicosa]KAI0844787.1 hypothetical protein F5Y00DRAFT_255752 [Daldinia vernicosa]
MGVLRELPSQTDPCEPVDLGDPDITGFGVLISFLFSIVLVIVAIIWAYVKDILPGKCYNGFDNVMLNRKHRNEDGQGVRGLQNFILALSDQQLVSGLALAISINIIRNGVQDLDTKISAYAYGNAVILAFLSCIIHLATIAVLRDYLRDRSYLKHVRVVIMLCVISLLLQGLGETWTLYQYETLRCAIAHYGFLEDDSDAYGSLEILGNPALVSGFTVLLGILVSGYVRRIRDLYFPNSRDFPGYWQVFLFEKTIGWPTLSKDRILEAREHLASRLSEGPLGISQLAHIFFVIIPPSFHRSFMFEVVWLLFYFTFGISEAACFLRLIDNATIDGTISFEPRFGQLLPLILMTLPFLAMAEGYSDLRDTRALNINHENGDDTVVGPSRPGGLEQENKEDIEFLTVFRSHRCLMKGLSWVYVVLYFSLCIYISLAVGSYNKRIYGALDV